MTALAFVARGNGYTGKPVCPRHSSKKASFQDELSSDTKLTFGSLSADVSQDTFEDILCFRDSQFIFTLDFTRSRDLRMAGIRSMITVAAASAKI